MDAIRSTRSQVDGESFTTDLIQRHGIYPLINQGRLPRYSDFSPAFAHLIPKNSFRQVAQQFNDSHSAAAITSDSSFKLHPRSAKDRLKLSLLDPLPTKTPHSSLADLLSISDHQENLSSRTSASIYICHGKLVENSIFITFVQSLAHHEFGHLIPWIQFLEIYCSKYAIDVLILDTLPLQKLCARYVASPLSIDILLEQQVISNRLHLLQLAKQPGRRYLGVDGHWAAIVKIQATWRMHRQRKTFRHLLAKSRAAAMIPIILQKNAARAALLRKFKKALPSHEMHVTQLRMSFVTNAPSEVVYIHVASCSLLERVRREMDTVRGYESQHVGRLSAVLQPGTRMVLVVDAADPLLPLAMQAIASSSRYPNALAHVHLVHPESLPQVPANAPLACALLNSPASLQTLHQHLNLHARFTPLYVPLYVDHYDIRTASLLHAAIPPNLDRPNRLPLLDLPYTDVPGKSTLPEAFTRLATLLQTHPGHTCWKFVLANELPPRSDAFFRLQRLKDIKKKLPENLEDLTALLLSTHENVFSTPFPGYFKTLCIFGGRIESVFAGSTANAHVKLSVNGEAYLLGTWEILNGRKRTKHPFDDIEDAITISPVRCISTFQLVQSIHPYIKKLYSEGLWDTFCFKFLVTQSNGNTTLRCMDIEPYWPVSASMNGLVRMFTDTRLDFATFHADLPPEIESTVSTSHFEAGRGLLVTDMSHLRPSRLKMAGAAKWLDYDKLRSREQVLLETTQMHTGEEPRSWICVHGLNHSYFTNSVPTLNMALEQEKFIDRDRRGCMFLNIVSPKRFLICVDDSVTQAIQRVFNVMHNFAMLVPNTHPSNCDFESWSARLFDFQTVAQEADARDLPGFAFTFVMPTVRSPPCVPIEEVPESTGPAAPVVDRYQQALLERELYAYQLKLNAFQETLAQMNTLHTSVIEETETLVLLHTSFAQQCFHIEEEAPVTEEEVSMAKYQFQKAKLNTSFKILKNVFHAVRRKI